MARSPCACRSPASAASRTPTPGSGPSPSRDHTASRTSPSRSRAKTRTRRVVRLFLAINFAPELRRSLFEATAPLREAAPALSWVRASHLHLTLKFFGEQSTEMAAQLETAVGQIAGRHRERDIEIADAGALPTF